jgi:hypothetical protein
MPVSRTCRSVERETEQSEGGGGAQGLGEHVEVARVPGAGGDEGVEELGRQALLEGAVAGGVDADAVAVEAVPAGAVALVHGDRDARLLRSVCQAHPAGIDRPLARATSRATR